MQNKFHDEGSLFLDTFFRLTTLLPLLILGLFWYSILVIIPRSFKKRRQGNHQQSPVQPTAGAGDAREPVRLRKIAPASTMAEAESTQIPSDRPAVQPNGGVRHSTADPGAISETVSVVLRRQIPPRFDEPLRSWLGGLPCMPEAVDWPRSISSEYPDRGERPLHFVAQICCADLPQELWGGLGPREGWLLLFVDPNQGCPGGDDALQVIHTLELGAERAPPSDLGPVHDDVYTGPDYSYLLPGETVPNVWRRWPVDIVTVPNEIREVELRVLAAPDNFASHLYPGEQIAPAGSQPPPVKPLTYGQALYALNDLRSGLERSLPPIQLSPVFCAELRKDGAIGELCGYAQNQAEQARKAYQEFLERLQQGDDSERLNEQLRRYSARNDHFERQVAWLKEMGDADAIFRYLEEGPALEAAWQEDVRSNVDAVIEAMRQHDPDTPLLQQDWGELVAVFEDRDFVRWQTDRMREAVDQPTISFREHRRSSKLHPPSAMRELLADMYVDPAQRALIPDDVLPAFEASWRQLDSNRPHRMGGYHDGLQSDAAPGPAKNLLLFQIATDNAMHWCWGDGGVYYVWIRPKHLAAANFSGVEMLLECH